MRKRVRCMNESKNQSFKRLIKVGKNEIIGNLFELYFEPIHDTRVPDILFDFVHGEMLNLSIK